MKRTAAAALDRGLLARPAGPEASPYALARSEPAADLRDVVERFWAVRWDLSGRPPFEQETLPFPCVNMVIGAHQPGVHGPVTARSVARMEGRGWVLGTMFRPAGFHGLLARGRSPSELVNRAPSIGATLGADGEAMERDVLASGEPLAAIARVESFVRQHHAGVEPADREANAIVDVARAEASITRVAALAARFGLSVRALERLFRARVGVPPKGVIRRFRVQEAAARLAEGADVDLAGLALELGYCDQAHFSHDFKSQVGRTPAAYVTHCAARRRG